jgi:hypothetical protein
MSVDQMLWHVNETLGMALDQSPLPPRDNALMRTVGKWLVLYGPWPKGRSPTMPHLRARSEHDFQAERERLLRLLDAFDGRSAAAAWPRHPMLGPLTGAEWMHLQGRHVDYHLRQFGV